MATESNGVIYLEVDEDITSAIDKLTKSAAKRVQIVTAKRSTLFQSVINLRLVQKAAKDSGRQLVLVTGDRVATSLAGRIGVAVASQVGEAAAIPSATPLSSIGLADDEIDGGSIGDTAKGAETPLATPPTPSPNAAAAPLAPPSKAKPGAKVPNIGKMQKRLIWGGLALVAIIALFGLNYYLTSAKVTLYAQGSQVNSVFSFTADPTVQKSEVSSNVVTAQQLTESKTLTSTVTASGTRDDGSKASGTMTISNCYDMSAHTLPAGTQFVATDGNSFVSTADATVPAGTPTLIGGHLSLKAGTTSVGVQAAQNGDSYNEASGGTYAVGGEPAGTCSSNPGGIYGTGGQMQGGITKIDKVITQNDVSQAQAAALAAGKAGATSDLNAKANNQQVVLGQSFQQTVTGSAPNPAVGSVASSASLAVQVTYAELAVAKSDLSALAQSQETQQLGPQSQIYDDGSGDLQITALGEVQSNGGQRFKAAATAYAGTKINTAALAKQLKGKKLGDAQTTAAQVAGVSKADVSVSPSWATSLPHILSHIHVKIQVAKPSGS